MAHDFLKSNVGQNPDQPIPAQNLIGGSDAPRNANGYHVALEAYSPYYDQWFFWCSGIIIGSTLISRLYETCFLFIWTDVNVIFPLHINKTNLNKCCFLMNNGCVPGIAK